MENAMSNETELTAENIEKKADVNGMCTVRALHDNVMDNGHRYKAGQEFHMHKDLIESHAAAGQVELVDGSDRGVHGGGEKAQQTPKDKQVKKSPNKSVGGNPSTSSGQAGDGGEE